MDRAPFIGWDLPGGDEQAARYLMDPDPDVRAWMRGRLLREVKPEEAIARLGAQTIAEELEQVSRYLGRKRAFWFWLVGEWRARGYVS
jgi:Asp-tRNA(Asn)/Glu-tRNA(Gln) amidotransferase B subunit